MPTAEKNAIQRRILRRDFHAGPFPDFAAKFEHTHTHTHGFLCRVLSAIKFVNRWSSKNLELILNYAERETFSSAEIRLTPLLCGD